jgi:uncharacterized membrane protein YGL010W
MTQELQLKFNDYALHHAHPKNRLTHYLGIPLIAASTLGLFSLIKLGHIDAGFLIALIAMAFYFFLDKRIASYFMIPIALLYYIGASSSMAVLISMQVIGWITQYIGHYVYEKKSPAFYKNLQHLLIGPIWIFAKVIHYK